MPIRVMKPPSIIATQPNGAVDPALLTRIDRDGTLWYLATLPARGMLAMRAACHAATGVWLDSVGRGRTLAIQYAAFCGVAARYRPCTATEYTKAQAVNSEHVKKWPATNTLRGDGQTYLGRTAVAAILQVTIPNSDYWVKIGWETGHVQATAATPGSSPHGLWCADDVALPDGPDAGTAPDALSGVVLAWLYAHELEYGFAHSTTSELWHVQWYVGDVVPAAVLAFEASQQPVPPTPEIPPVPTIPNPPPTEDDMAELIQVNDDAAVLLRDGLVCTAVIEQGTVDALVTDGIVASANPRQMHRAALKAFELHGPAPSYAAYAGPKPGRTVASDFARWVA